MKPSDEKDMSNTKSDVNPGKKPDSKSSGKGPEEVKAEVNATETATDQQETDQDIRQDIDDDLLLEIERLQDELDRTRDTMLRKAAEFENLKKRTQKEKLQFFEQARADAVSRFLPIREDLKRSVEASEGHDLDKGFLEGLKLVLANFERVLRDYGMEPIEETGVPFDVNMHDALLVQPAEDESTESNTVVHILEPGYKLGDRVIKHAKVIVSQ